MKIITCVKKVKKTTGDVEYIRQEIKDFKNGYLYNDEGKWEVRNEDGTLYSKGNEEAYRKVSEEMIDTIKWAEEHIVMIGKVIEICHHILANLPQEPEEQPQEPKKQRKGNKKHRRNKQKK